MMAYSVFFHIIGIVIHQAQVKMNALSQYTPIVLTMTMEAKSRAASA
jgi:hypothetical protein